MLVLRILVPTGPETPQISPISQKTCKGSFFRAGYDSGIYAIQAGVRFPGGNANPQPGGVHFSTSDLIRICLISEL